MQLVLWPGCFDIKSQMLKYEIDMSGKIHRVDRTEETEDFETMTHFWTPATLLPWTDVSFTIIAGK